MIPDGGRSNGRAGLGPFLLALPLAFATFAVLHLLERPQPAGPWSTTSEPLPATAPSDSPALRPGFAAEITTASGGELRFQLTPLRGEREELDFLGRSLAQRHGLAPGAPWRLMISGDVPLADGTWLSEVRILDADGVALRWLGVQQPARPGPMLSVLLAPSLGPEAELTLWGRWPEAPARLELAGLVEGAVALEEVRFSADELSPGVLHLGQRDAVARSHGGREGELERLRDELELERQKRQERELEWYRFNRALTKLDLGEGQPEFPVDPADLPEGSVPEEEQDGAQESEEVSEETAPGSAEEEADDLERRQARAEEIGRSLRALLTLEEVQGLDLLEVGQLGDGWIGPVLFRLLDKRGTLTGSLYAERLRLEASRAAQTVTLVLEEGYESRAGLREPFADGVRRLVLPLVSPARFFDSVPELFLASKFLATPDDGLWDLEELRSNLNRLLAEDITGGWYRLRSLGGVLGDEWIEVHLESFDSGGRIRRRIFADRMRIERESPGVVLFLEDGAIVHGDKKDGFLGGTYRVFLPRAKWGDWVEVGMPGVGPAHVTGAQENEGDEGSSGGG